MFQNTSVSDELSFYKFFKKLNFDLYLTKLQIKHLENIMNAMISKGFNGKVSDVAELSSARYRTSITRFLSNSSWDEKLLERALKAYIVELIWAKSKKLSNQYILLLITLFQRRQSPRQRLRIQLKSVHFIIHI